MTVASVSPAALAVAADMAPVITPAGDPGGTAIPAGMQAAEAAVAASVQSDYGRLPMHFEPNVGQQDAAVKFSARGPGYQLFLMPEEAMLVLSQAKAPAADSAVPAVATGAVLDGSQREQADQRRTVADHTPPAVVRMRLEGPTRQPAPTLEGLEPQPGVSNYLRGNDPAQWRTAVPHYARVKYSAVYPGIDLVYYGNPQQLEYDFILAPGADPNQIALTFEGAEGIRLAENGDLILSVGGGELVQQAPRIYQEIAGERRVVEGRYLLKTDATAPDALPRIGFEVASYQADVALVIDPVLVYSTYLGGSGYDTAHGIAVDTAGNAYVMGTTSSVDFPTRNAIDPTYHGFGDVFVAKINSQGNGLVYSTYLGGSDTEESRSIAVDAAGNAYVTGSPWSSDFPTYNALNSTLGGEWDAFVTKLNAIGNALVFSTYLGGSDVDIGHGIAVDVAGNAYVTGLTQSLNFPTRNAFDPTYNGDYEAFVTKINAGGDTLVYSTYLGGSDRDEGKAIAVDAAGTAYIVGDTSSRNFPTKNAYDRTLGAISDAFITKLNARGNALIYSTYLGGSGLEYGNDIAVDAAGNAYVTGTTLSPDFPTLNAYDRTLGSTRDAFVTKLKAGGKTLVYSTYLGGRSREFANGIAVDAAGNAYVTGDTSSKYFPTVNAYDPTINSGIDAYVTQLSTSGNALIYSTYLGGSGYDRGTAIAVDTVGSVYVTGDTNSNDFPSRNALDGWSDGWSDAFVTKISKQP